MADRLLTVKEAALILSVLEGWAYRWSQSGRRNDWRYLNPLRLGRLGVPKERDGMGSAASGEGSHSNLLIVMISETS